MSSLQRKMSGPLGQVSGKMENPTTETHLLRRSVIEERIAAIPNDLL